MLRTRSGTRGFRFVMSAVDIAMLRSEAQAGRAARSARGDFDEPLLFLALVINDGYLLFPSAEERDAIARGRTLPPRP